MKNNKVQIARQLRQAQTSAEAELWELLRNRKFQNLKFRRQHPLKDYIVDFYCDSLGLIIELDGNYHNTSEQKEANEHRDFHLSALGYKVLRYRNEVVFGNVELIYNDIIRVKHSVPLSAGEGAGVRELTILSTKKLTPSQRELLLNSGLSFVEYDAIKIEYLDFEIPKRVENAIFTSQNGVKSVLASEISIKNCFCVGEKTAALLIENGENVVKVAKNGKELAQYLIKNHKNESFHYFCGTKRREELPNLLKKQEIELFELKTYKTELEPKKFSQNWNGILFFSPSGVESFVKGQKEEDEAVFNFPEKTLLFCIGTTTASEAKKYSDNVIVANSTTVESVIAKAVKTLRN